MIVEVRGLYELNDVPVAQKLKETIEILDYYQNKNGLSSIREHVRSLNLIYDKILDSNFFKTIIITDDKMYLVELDRLKDDSIYWGLRYFSENNKKYMEFKGE